MVRNAIADEDFTSATYKRVFDHADNVWAANSANTTVVSALSKANPTPETVAAVQGGKKGNRGGRGNRGGGANRGGGSANSSGTARGGGQSGGQGGQSRARPPRHPDGPPSRSCRTHWQFGRSAWFCADRHNCPWRDIENPRPRDNRNIVSEIIED